MGEVSVENLLN